MNREGWLYYLIQILYFAFKCFVKLLVFPLNTYCIIRNPVQVAWQSLKEICCSHNLSLWREQPCMVFDSQIFYCYLLKHTFVWYLLDIFKKQQFCVTDFLTQLPQITLSFVCFKQLFMYTHWWKSVMLQNCISTASLVGWLLLSLFN